MNIAVKGIGPVGAFGHGIDEFQKLLTGEKQVSPETVSVNTGRDQVDLPLFSASTAGLEAFFSKRSLRRLDHFSAMALLGACLSLEDAGLEAKDMENAGLIVATGYGASRTTFAFLDSFLDNGDSASQPTRFSHSVHNAAAAHISMKLGIKGPSLTISQFDLSFISAMITARQWLMEKRVDTVLVGCVDEYSDVTGYAMASFMGNCSKGQFSQLKNSPQNIQPHGSNCAAGEGACFFILQGESAGCTSPYGFIKDVDIRQLGNSGDLYGSAGLIDTEDDLAAMYNLPAAQESQSKSQKLEKQLPMVIMGSKGYGACKQTRGMYNVQKTQKNLMLDINKGAEQLPLTCVDGKCPPFSFTHLYGNFPAGSGFDLTVAALSLKQGRVYPMDTRDCKKCKKTHTSLKKIYCLKPCENLLHGLMIIARETLKT